MSIEDMKISFERELSRLRLLSNATTEEMDGFIKAIERIGKKTYFLNIEIIRKLSELSASGIQNNSLILELEKSIKLSRLYEYSRYIDKV